MSIKDVDISLSLGQLIWEKQRKMLWGFTCLPFFILLAFVVTMQARAQMVMDYRRHLPNMQTKQSKSCTRPNMTK